MTEPKYIPKPGDIFEWCDEQYICIESYSSCGVVNTIGETYYIRGFMWDYQDEIPKFIRKSTEEELERIGLNVKAAKKVIMESLLETEMVKHPTYKDDVKFNAIIHGFSVNPQIKVMSKEGKRITEARLESVSIEPSFPEEVKLSMYGDMVNRLKANMEWHKHGTLVECSNDKDFKKYWKGIYIGKHPLQNKHIIYLPERKHLDIKESVDIFEFWRVIGFDIGK